jgi:hypothetical protein
MDLLAGPVETLLHIHNATSLGGVLSEGRPTQEGKSLLNERPKEPVVIGYTFSLIKCGDFQSTQTGLVDASLVLRHSVHQTSVRNPASGSVYDYKMYAIVHRKAEECAQTLKDAGFEILVRDNPVARSEIQGEFLRNHIHREWCCGEDEFIKLYAYKMDDVPIVVHVDIDFSFVKPMDDLFDAMLYSQHSEIGRGARERIPVEFPNELTRMPDNIDAFMTRDWPQVMPGRKAAFQAGFLVLKPNPKVFDLIVDVLRKGDYVDGYGRDNGWGGKGYGVFVGAMAMQGLLAYVYDILLYDSWVELNQCRFNHIGMDVLYRNQPAFKPSHPKVGKCRNDRDYCEDCMQTDVSKIYSIHYCQCRKPWNCIGGAKSVTGDKRSIPDDTVNLDHCLQLMTAWHRMRDDLETKLLKLTKDKSIDGGRNGTYKSDVFFGHCRGNGGENYLPIAGKTETFRALLDLYKTEKNAVFSKPF